MKISTQLVQLQHIVEQVSVNSGMKSGKGRQGRFDLLEHNPIIADSSNKYKANMEKNEGDSSKDQSNSVRKILQLNMMGKLSSVAKSNSKKAVQLIESILRSHIHHTYSIFYSRLLSKSSQSSLEENLQLQTGKIRKNLKLKNYEPQNNGQLRRITEKDEQNEEIDTNSSQGQLTKKLFEQEELKDSNPIHRLRNKSINGKPCKIIERKNMFGSCWQKKYKNAVKIIEQPFQLEKQTDFQHIPLRLVALEKQPALSSATNEIFDTFSQLPQKLQGNNTPKCKQILSFGLDTIKFKNELIKQKEKFQLAQKQIALKQTNAIQTSNSNSESGKKIIKIRAKLHENIGRYQQKQESFCCFSGCGSGGYIVPSLRKNQEKFDRQNQVQNKQKNCNWSLFDMLKNQLFTSEQIKNSIASTNIKTSSFQQDNFINQSNNQIKLSNCSIANVQKQRNSYSFTNKNRLPRTKLHRRFDQNDVNRTYNSNCSSPSHYQLGNSSRIQQFRKQSDYLSFYK